MNATGRFGSNCGGRPAYLLESGFLNAQNGLVMNGGTNVARSAYLHFRQTGGDFSASKLQVTNIVSGLNADIAFGGSGAADIGSGGLHVNGDATFSFNDNVRFSLDGGIGILGGHHIWAYSGGTAESRFLTTDGFSLPDGDFFALDGGSIAYGHSSDGTTSDLFGSNPEIRVYERGGGIAVNSTNRVDIDGIDFIAPKGNVLKSIVLTDALKNTVFTTPPSVEITDATGTNAAAVVDYDFDSRMITNITIVSRGENYTAPTANLRFQRGTDLLSTPLACTVGPEEEGDFTFSATNLGAQVWIDNSTNFTHGTLVVDMDQLGLIDGRNRTDDAAKTSNTLVIDYFSNQTGDGIYWPRFPNLTKIVIKSGALCIASSWGYNHLTSINFLPKCYMLEMYGGHIAGGSFAVSNFTVGGTAYLTGHKLNQGVRSVSHDQSSPYWADINVTRKSGADKDAHANWRTTSVPDEPGTMVVDVDATPDGEPSRLFGGTGTYSYSGYQYKYGTLRFGGTEANKSTLTIKNYESLRKTKARRTLLDLSATSINVFGTNFVNAVTPPDIAVYGQLQWNPVQRKLYWKPSGGLYLIFK